MCFNVSTPNAVEHRKGIKKRDKSRSNNDESDSGRSRENTLGRYVYKSSLKS